MRLSSIAAVAVCAALALAPAATAKGDVVATLVPAGVFDVPPGSPVDVTFRLQSREGLFSANGIFVRVREARTGRKIEVAAEQRSFGWFSARFTMPAGGVDDVVVGLQGIRSGPEGTVRSDLLFPIANDPFPGRPRAAEADRSRSAALVAGGLLLLAALAVGIARRRGGRTDAVGGLRATRVASSGPDRSPAP